MLKMYNRFSSLSIFIENSYRDIYALRPRLLISFIYNKRRILFIFKLKMI